MGKEVVRVKINKKEEVELRKWMIDRYKRWLKANYNKRIEKYLKESIAYEKNKLNELGVQLE